MKPEPLKGKKCKMRWGFGNQKTPNESFFHYDKDIHSAVEWLKLEDVKAIRSYNFGDITWGDLNRKLDENREKAFEDVVKEKI